MSKYVNEKPMTVCRECTHYCSGSFDHPDQDCCDSLGYYFDVVRGGVRFPPCQDLNDGNCPQFEETP